MKLFRVIIISISVLFGRGHAVGEMPVPKWIEDDRKSYVKYNFRYTQYLSLRLSKDEKNQHKSAVYFMLNSIPNGEIVTWHSAKRLVTGKVRVIQSYTIYANFGLSILKKLASPFKAFKASQGRYIYMHNPHRELL